MLLDHGLIKSETFIAHKTLFTRVRAYAKGMQLTDSASAANRPVPEGFLGILTYILVELCKGSAESSSCIHGPG